MKKNWMKPELHELDVKDTELTLLQNGSDGVITEALVNISGQQVTVPVGS